MLRQYKVISDIESSFDQVIGSIDNLVSAYRQSQVRAWALDHPTPNGDWLAKALLDIWYEDGQDGRVTRPYVALIAARPALLQAVSQVNIAKGHFQQLLAEVKALGGTLVPDLKRELPSRHPVLVEQMRGSGLARLHLKQCWRAVPVADAPLERVRLSWYCSGRSIKRLSVRDAEQHLLKMNTEAPHIQIQLKALAGIPPMEPLAQVQQQAPVMRANLFFRDIAEAGRERRALNVALPLFIPSTDGSLPIYNMPPPFPPSERVRKIRSDEQLEHTPFLPSLRVHRYRAPT